MKSKLQQKDVIKVIHPIQNDLVQSEFLKLLPRRMDFSCVRTIHDQRELQNLVDSSKKFRPACAFTLPFLTDYLVEELKDTRDVKVGGVISFPSGGDTTEDKMYQARELRRKGCGELDMVMNLTLLKTEQYKRCLDDLKSVISAAGGIPVKVIIEASLLTDDEICRASELAVRAGSAFVKTGTGWVGAATVKQVELIYKTIGNESQIKAAGGIRTLSAISELYHAGCDRFGVGVSAAESILRETGF